MIDVYRHRVIPRFILLSLVVLAAMGAAASAQSPSYFWPAATDVVVFKDGPAYLVRAGEAVIGADGVVTERIPRPILGTLDVYSLTEGVRVREIVAFREEVERPAAIREAEEFYRRQIGRRVALLCADGAQVEGVLQSVLSPGSLLIEADEGSVLVSLANVQRMQLAGGAVTEMPLTEERSRLRIRLAGGTGRARLGLSYLEEGWNWFPSYRLNLRGENQAELILHATVVNEAEDVDGAALHLVVGVPDFSMRGRLSPMALDVETGAVKTARGATLFASNMEDRADYGAKERSLASPEAEVRITGSVEDLFVFEKKNFSLARGQRMQLELYRGLVPCESVYKWTMPLGPGLNEDVYRARNYRGEETGRIWHYLRLENETEIPWPAAPMMVVSGWQPIGQGNMEHIPAGGSSDLPVTVAPDIEATAREEEIARKTVRLANRDYAQITIRGTLILKNTKNTPVNMEIVRDLLGEVREAGGGKAAKKAGSWGVNPHSVLEWKLALRPKEERTVEYLYHYWLAI